MNPSPALTPHAIGLPAEVADALDLAGFSVAGVASVADYDRIVPASWQSNLLLHGARSVVVLGTAGGRFEAGWRAAERDAPGLVRDPVDDHARRVLNDCAATWARLSAGIARAFLYCDRFRQAEGPPEFADFVALARASGLGEPSRLGLLVHPTFGPWWSVRGLMIATHPLRPTNPTEDFAPCAGCSAPCLEVCPANAPSAAGFDAGACATHRLEGPQCADGCAARRACVHGTAWALAPRDEAVYSRASLGRLKRFAEGETD